jgi:hypothetical protein
VFFRGIEKRDLTPSKAWHEDCSVMQVQVTNGCKVTKGINITKSRRGSHEKAQAKSHCMCSAPDPHYADAELCLSVVLGMPRARVSRLPGLPSVSRSPAETIRLGGASAAREHASRVWVWCSTSPWRLGIQLTSVGDTLAQMRIKVPSG